MANDFERLMSQYSEPVRSWPGEEARDKALDEEAVQAAKAAGLYHTPETGINRDTLLPWAYDVNNGVRSQNGSVAVPGMAKDGLGKGFTLFRLTPEIKKKVIEEGQPLFAKAGPQPVNPFSDASDDRQSIDDILSAYSKD